MDEVERHRLARNYQRVVAERDSAVVERDRLAAEVEALGNIAAAYKAKREWALAAMRTVIEDAEIAEADCADLRDENNRLAAKVARVEALIDPEAGMAATPYGTGAGRYFEERNLLAALADPEEPQ